MLEFSFNICETKKAGYQVEEHSELSSSRDGCQVEERSELSSSRDSFIGGDMALKKPVGFTLSVLFIIGFNSSPLRPATKTFRQAAGEF